MNSFKYINGFQCVEHDASYFKSGEPYEDGKNTLVKSIFCSKCSASWKEYEKFVNGDCYTGIHKKYSSSLGIKQPNGKTIFSCICRDCGQSFTREL
jgi:hypothetical protein